MIEANCPNCNRRRKFTPMLKNKYKCTSCGSILHKCINKDCSQMISIGLYCRKCVGSTLKKGGVLAVTGLMIIGGAVLKSLNSGKNDES